MTNEDVLAREGIRDVIARYNIAGDRLRIDDFAACFTHDAILESDRVPEDRAFRFVGRDAIRDWQTQWRDRAASGTPVHEANFVRHHLTTSQIDLVTRDNATARTYWQAWTRIGPDHAGYYLDDLRRVNGHWLIAHRRVRMDWEAEESLFKPAIARTRDLRGQA
ncbi:nuclear transport factor 2 family protein [Novosphingobium sp. BL-8A]|uniref:nuclear transport factor 2 family protein n=1 Tax=Novosphingobium sp. BL-8A TaxID=3127639 RepID=UPI003756CCCB